MYSQKIFAVYDSKAKAYLQPFFCVNSAVAVRAFESAVNDERHEFHRYSSDFILFEIGAYDEDEGLILGVEPKVSLGVACEFLKPAGFPEPAKLPAGLSPAVRGGR